MVSSLGGRLGGFDLLVVPVLVAGVMCVVVVTLGTVCGTLVASCAGWSLSASCRCVVNVRLMISNLSTRGGVEEDEGADVGEYWEVPPSSVCPALLLLRLLVLLLLRLLVGVTLTLDSSILHGAGILSQGLIKENKLRSIEGERQWPKLGHTTELVKDNVLLGKGFHILVSLEA